MSNVTIERTGNSWVEPLEEWINTLYLAQKLAVGNDFDAIKSFMKKIGTNHELWNKRAEVKLKEEYALVPQIKAGNEFPETEKAQFAALCGINFDKSPVWLGC